MDPMVVAAQFAAFTWYSNGKVDTPAVRRAAQRFAEENWGSFLSNAHEGLGRLLLRIAQRPIAGRARPRQRALPCSRELLCQHP